VIVSLLALPIAAMATPGAGFVFNFLNRFTSTTDAIHEHAHDKGWSVELEVQGATDFVEQDVMLAPGGFSGWHSHPGPVLITVKSGTATGSAFIEPANAHHYVANKGSDNLNWAPTSFPEGRRPARSSRSHRSARPWRRERTALQLGVDCAGKQRL
jgi:hypothetical protein